MTCAVFCCSSLSESSASSSEPKAVTGSPGNGFFVVLSKT